MSSLNPRQFEVFCCEYFKLLGNNAYLMPEGPDGGKDVILNKNTYVECKSYNESLIGREICQKLLGAVTADGMKQGIIFTNGKIHQNALDFLRKTKPLEIWNSEVIYKNSLTIKAEELSKLFDYSTALKSKYISS